MRKNILGYSHGEANSYQLTEAIASEISPVEKSIHQWLKSSLESRLPTPGLIADIGCGSGRLLPWLRDSQRSIIGMDASLPMLERIVLPTGKKPVIHKRFKPIGLGEELFIQSDLCAGLKTLIKNGVEVDAALGSFVLVCFSEPAKLFNSVWKVLKSGGLLWITTNLFMPTPKCTEEELPVSLKFKHWLHLPTGSILLHDYVHSFKRVFTALEKTQWEIMEHSIFPAEGCEHIQDPECFSPNESWTYVKAGFLLRKVA